MKRDGRTIGGLLEARAEVAPDRPFVTFEHGSVTFSEIDLAANRVANALAGLGLQPGDRAAAMLSNRPEYLATWFGMAKAGVIEVPLNTGLRGDLLAYMLAHSGARLLVIDPKLESAPDSEALRGLAGPPEAKAVVEAWSRSHRGWLRAEPMLAAAEILLRPGDEVEAVGYKSRKVDASVVDRLARETPMRATLRAGKELPVILSFVTR